MNNVVLGDLALYNGNDALSFASPAIGCRLGSEIALNIGDLVDVLIRPFTAKVNINENVFDGLNGGALSRFDINLRNSVILQQPYFDYYIDGVLNATVVAGEEHLLTLEVKSPGYGIGTIGARLNLNENVFDGTLRDIRINSVPYYIQDGDFGDTVLTDHSGNGNDGFLNGATWWKEGVNENFLTPQAYKSSWVTPMVDAQTVTYTDAVPYYDKDNSFWNPYNTDSTYKFHVSTLLPKVGSGRFRVVQDLYSLLSTMTTANGYTLDYTAVESVLNDSPTMKQTPYIGLVIEEDEEYDGPQGFNNTTYQMPFVVVVRSKTTHRFKNEIEKAEALNGSRVISDIRTRFVNTRPIVGSCARIIAGEGVDPSEFGLSDTNKHDFFTAYRLYAIYKEV